MARIKTARHGRRTTVTLAGDLTADDLRRLEHACGGALTVDPPPLTLDVSDVTSIDQSALAVLRHLETRGAEISGRTLGAIPARVHPARLRGTVREPRTGSSPAHVLRDRGRAASHTHPHRRDARLDRHR